MSLRDMGVRSQKRPLRVREVRMKGGAKGRASTKGSGAASGYFPLYGRTRILFPLY
jgi:hypothetical protein